MVNLKAGLYIVSTPIGNLGDISYRAVETLKHSDIIICEDTRISKKLLEYFDINKKLIVYNDHSDQSVRDYISDLILKENKIISLISDAGTPLISDPGYKLIRYLYSVNCFVDTIPGACSLIAALTISGLPTDRFFFEGFLPRTKLAKEKIFNNLLDLPATLIFFETANRLVDSLEVAFSVLGNREAAVVREITKLFQESKLLKITDMIEYYKTKQIKGEIVLLISGANISLENIAKEQIIEMLKNKLITSTVKDSVASVYEEVKNISDWKKNDIYKMALELSK